MFTNRECLRSSICDEHRRHGGTTDTARAASVHALANTLVMPKLCPSRHLLDAAMRAGKAIAALNFYNAETLIAHVRAAEASKESIILQTTESTINYLGLRMIFGMATAAADQLEEPVALHLDHGSSYELAARCIDAGYTSV